MSITLRKCFKTIAVNDSITVTGHLVRLDDRKKKYLVRYLMVQPMKP